MKRVHERQSILPGVRAIAAAGVTAFAAGCSGYQDPAITSAGAMLVERGDEALTVRLAIDLHNPNNEPLKLLEFDYRVSVNGVNVYRGVRAAETTLASDGRKQIAIPAVVRYDTMKWMAGEADVPATAAYEVRGSLRYITPGGFAQALFDSGLRKPSAGFGWSGVADLGGTPAVATAQTD